MLNLRIILLNRPTGGFNIIAAKQNLPLRINEQYMLLSKTPLLYFSAILFSHIILRVLPCHMRSTSSPSINTKLHGPFLCFPHPSCSSIFQQSTRLAIHGNQFKRNQEPPSESSSLYFCCIVKKSKVLTAGIADKVIFALIKTYALTLSSPLNLH